MLSDESSSDSETGRFKGQTKTVESKNSGHRDDSFRSGRSRPSENDRFRRDFGRRERDEFNKHSRDRHRYSRNSPGRRKHSRDRSPRRRSGDRTRERDRDSFKTHGRRNSSRDRQKRSRSVKSPEVTSKAKSPEPKSKLHKSPEPKSKSHKSPEIKIRSHRTPESKTKPQRPSEPRRDLKEEIKRTLEPNKKLSPKTEGRSPKRERENSPKTKYDRRSREKSSSPEYRAKKSEIYIPPASAPLKRKSSSPVVLEVHSDSEKSEEVQLGSYYNMIPAVVKEKEVSSEIDSSDDEKLRAKLLNLEKELEKTRKKKHRKKHKRKHSKSKEREIDVPVVEVSSTTDIQDKVKEDSSQSQAEAVPEVSSTQKSSKKESSEEGEISSDDDSQIEYDASDLRHKLRQSKGDGPKIDVCGPALPPHLKTRNRRSTSQDIEGPALPPHLQSRTRTKHLGPSIPEDLRKVLAEREVVKYESSDEDDGIGPLPAGSEEKLSDAHQRLEERALDIKIKSIEGRSLDSQKVKSREEWMLQLPEGKAKYLGLEARSFRAKEGPDMSDRSSWTDTPEEKARKAAGVEKEEDADVVLKRDARARLIENRDEEQEQAVKKHKKKHKREESLLEQHQKKLKKKKKKEEKESDGRKERRPFSRDVDLQVNRFDEAQKKSIIKKAQDLNSRFGRGEAKYL